MINVILKFLSNIILIQASRMRRMMRAKGKINKKTLEQLTSHLKFNIFSQYVPFSFLCTKTRSVPLGLNNSIEKIGKQLRDFAAYRNLVYLTANQINSFDSCFVIHKEPNIGMWSSQSYKKPEDFQLYVNPKIEKYISPKLQEQQQCTSFPMVRASIERSDKIQVSYMKLEEKNGEFVKDKYSSTTEEIQGFKAKVYQHCMDHLMGKTFFSWKLTKGRLKVEGRENDFENFRFVMKEYNLRVKLALQKGEENSKQSLQMKNRYQERLRKVFRDESQEYKKKVEQAKIKMKF